MNRKKIISILLTLCMFFSNFQPVIYALDTTEVPEDINAVEMVEETTDSELMDEVEISEEPVEDTEEEIETEEPAQEPEEEILQEDEQQETPEAETEETPAEETQPEEPAEIPEEENAEETEIPEEEYTEEPELSEEETLFNGMPEDYVLSEEELAEKQALRDNNVLADLANSVEGEDYIAGQVTYYFADQAVIETVANAYNAEIVETTKYYAVFALAEGTTVADAMAYAVADNNVPAVSPRQLYKAEKPSLNTEGSDVMPMGVLTEIPEITGWEDWGRDADPYINMQWTWTQWYLREIGVFEAWATTQGSDKITVAVIDSGIVNTEVRASFSFHRSFKEIK